MEMSKSVLLITTCVTVFLETASAQTSGIILGAVHDASGAPVPNATITVTEVNKGTSQTAKTEENGDYNVPFLTPGTYRVAVEASGFSRQQSADTPLSVDQRARLDFTLQVGDVSQTLDVVASAPLVRSESSELGEVIAERAIRELPLNGRNFAQLVYLVPGVTPGQSGENLSGNSTFNPRAPSNFNALGSQANANAWLVDGIIDNEYTFNTVMVQPSVESIQEFKVLTGTFSAEYGRGAGVVTTQTHSGSNEFHGTAFEFLRNNYFDARNFFNAKPQTQTPLRRNQYGGSIGGPIWKNHTFFFADYYGQREIKGQTFINTVPTAQQRLGNFSDIAGLTIFNPFTTRVVNGQIVRDPFPGNQIPSNLINPVSANVVSLYPLPNLPGTSNNRVDSLNRNLTDNGGNVRIDHKISDRDTLFGRYSFEKFTLFDTRGQGGCCIPTPPSAAARFDLGPFIAGGQNTELTASGLAINETHVFSPVIVNEFLVGFARTNPLTTQSDFGHNSATSIGVQGINISEFSTGLPTINIQGTPGTPDYTAINGGPGFLPAHPRQTSYQVGDTVAWTIGTHQTRFGFRLVKDKVSPFTNTDTRGTLNFNRNFTADPTNNSNGNGTATLLLGFLTAGSAAAGSRGFLQQPYYLSSWENSAFVQDDWKIHPRLTLNLGLRWDVFTPAREQNNRLTNFDLTNLTLVYANVNGVSRTAGLETKWRNFGPRVGFAWDAFGGGKTVIRGGFGMAYFPEMGSASNIIGQNVPWTISQNTIATNLYPTSLAGFPVISNPFPPPTAVMPVTTADLIAANPRILGQSFTNQTPYYETWTLNIERQIGNSMVAEVAYAGSRGIHLLYGYNPQEVLPGPASVPANNRVTLPQIATVRNIVQLDERNMSNFHSLQGKLTKRFSAGVQFLASYTYSKSLDYGGSAASGGGAVGNPQTITNLKAGYGPSGFDMRHRFVGSWVYETPFGKGRKYLNSGWVSNILGGWELDGIATLNTGRPFSVTLANGVTNGGPSWPDRIASGKLDNPTRAQWFDATAFAAPNTPRYGNVARGVLYSPGTVNFDLSAAKNFAIRERFRVQFRVDAFNAFNKAQFGFPAASINVDPVTLRGTPSTFTGITSTIADNRDLQLALKLFF
jgi:hypothetical protein